MGSYISPQKYGPKTLKPMDSFFGPLLHQKGSARGLYWSSSSQLMFWRQTKFPISLQKPVYFLWRHKPESKWSSKLFFKRYFLKGYILKLKSFAVTFEISISKGLIAVQESEIEYLLKSFDFYLIFDSRGSPLGATTNSVVQHLSTILRGREGASVALHSFN